MNIDNSKVIFNEYSQHDESESDDTVIVEENKIFTDISIVSKMEQLLNELKNINTKPSLLISCDYSTCNVIPKSHFKLRVNKSVKKMKKKFNDLTSDLIYIKESIKNDYYMIKEFTDQFKIKFMKRDLDQRLVYFNNKIRQDFKEIINLLENFKKYDFFLDNDIRDLIINYRLTINIRDNLIFNLNIDLVNQLISSIIQICDNSFNF